MRLFLVLKDRKEFQSRVITEISLPFFSTRQSLEIPFAGACRRAPRETRCFHL